MRHIRRDKGMGCIRLRKDGRWEGRLSADGYDPVYVYGKTKREVQNRLFAEQSKPRLVRDQESLIVREWLDRWLELVKSSRRFKTYDLYKAIVTNHINPHIGNFKLDRLSKTQIYDMLDALKKGGVGDAVPLHRDPDFFLS